LAELSELRMRTLAPKEVAAQLLFELADGTGQRRLCYVALLCRAREIKRPRDSEEIANLMHFHCITPRVSIAKKRSERTPLGNIYRNKSSIVTL
jgi:hypothetical protein